MGRAAKVLAGAVCANLASARHGIRAAVVSCKGAAVLSDRDEQSAAGDVKRGNGAWMGSGAVRFFFL